MDLITFVDVEASGLKVPESYPIEIGWADTLGNGESYLIRPEPDWLYWDAAAEAVHGISREQLFREGLSVIEVVERLERSFGLETAYCDAVDFDGHWIRRLYEAAGMEPSFKLADVRELYGIMGVERAVSLQRIVSGLTADHRAQADAERYAKAYRQVRGSNDQT